jgi:hypothetical protein
MSRYVLGVVSFFFGSISISPLFLILSWFILVLFVLALVSVFVVLYVCPVPITTFVVFFVFVSPCLVVCNCEVLSLCKGRRYVCLIFHVINLPHDNLYAKGLGEVNIMLGPIFSSIYVSITVLFIPFCVSVPHLLHFCLSFVLSFLAYHTQLCHIYHMWIWSIL